MKRIITIIGMAGVLNTHAAEIDKKSPEVKLQAIQLLTNTDKNKKIIIPPNTTKTLSLQDGALKLNAQRITLNSYSTVIPPNTTKTLSLQDGALKLSAQRINLNSHGAVKVGYQKMDLPKVFLGIAIDRTSAVTALQLGMSRGVGLDILKVNKDTPAAKAGMKAHDVIYKLGNQKLVNQNQLHVLLNQFKAGDTVTFSYFRKGKQQTIDVKLEGRKLSSIPDVINLNIFEQGAVGDLPPEIDLLKIDGKGKKMIPLNGKGLDDKAIILNIAEHKKDGEMLVDLVKIVKMKDGKGSYLLKDTQEGIHFTVKDQGGKVVYKEFIERGQNLEEIPKKYQAKIKILRSLAEQKRKK